MHLPRFAWPLFVVALLASCAQKSYSQEFQNLQSTGVYGYTSIDYEPSTNVVTAYSETDDYGEALYYYAVTVNLCSGQTCIQHQAVNANVTSVNATLTYQGSPGNTYNASGQHGGEYTTKHSSGGTFEDPDALYQWADYDVDDPWQFPFSPFSEGDNPDELQIQIGLHL